MIRNRRYAIECDIPNSFGIDIYFDQFVYEIMNDDAAAAHYPVWISTL